MVNNQCHHPFLLVKLRGQHSRVRLHANFCRGSRAITYPETRNRGRLESRHRLFMVIHSATNIPEFLSGSGLSIYLQYRNQSVNQRWSRYNGNIGLHLFQEKTSQQWHRGNARDHNWYYPIHSDPPGNHATTSLHSHFPRRPSKLYSSRRCRENHDCQSQHLRTPKMWNLRIHHVLGWNISNTVSNPNCPCGTLFRQRTYGCSIFNALPA